jgi:O-antigen biosynthesis protein
MAKIKMGKYHKSRALRQVSFSRSPVDILIPFYGQHDRVAKLVESILLVTKSNPYQICLIDDASPNEKFILDMAEVPQVVTVRNEKQLGFGGALEVGFNVTEQPWVCIMHSDVIVEDPGWLVEMGRSLQRWKEEGKSVKLVSAKTNRPGPNVERLHSTPKTFGEDFILEEGYVPLYCAMCHRDLFYYIDGFIKNYPYAWFEDQELAFRMKAYGYFQGICGRSWVRHFEGSTVNTLLKEMPEVRKVMEENRSRCIADMQLLLN